VLGLVFADLDRAFAVVSQCGYIGRWSLPSFKKISDGRPDKKEKWSGFRDIDFIKDPREPSSNDELLQLGVVGTDGEY